MRHELLEQKLTKRNKKKKRATTTANITLCTSGIAIDQNFICCIVYVPRIIAWLRGRRKKKKKKQNIAFSRKSNRKCHAAWHNAQPCRKTPEKSTTKKKRTIHSKGMFVNPRFSCFLDALHKEITLHHKRRQKTKTKKNKNKKKKKK
jgi:hypothetical protein